MTSIQDDRDLFKASPNVKVALYHVNPLGLPGSSQSCGTQTRPGYGAANYRPSCNRAVAVSCAVRIPLYTSPGHDVCAPAADDVHAGGTTAVGPSHAGYRGRVCSRTSHGRNRSVCLSVQHVSCWPNCVLNVFFFFFFQHCLKKE